MIDYNPKNLRLWTMPPDYAGEVWPAYYIAGDGQHRDSDALARSNFRVLLKRLGGESETVTVVREGHWAVGWVEWIAIHQDDGAALQVADECAADLADYPILDESDYSELEQEDADEAWKNCYRSADRLKYIREHRSQFEFHDMADLLGCVRGEYFAGCASELLG